MESVVFQRAHFFRTGRENVSVPSRLRTCLALFCSWPRALSRQVAGRSSLGQGETSVVVRRCLECALEGPAPPRFSARSVSLAVARRRVAAGDDEAWPEEESFSHGAVAKVCAGISNGRVVMWEYVPSKWNGDEAANLYRGAIQKTLREQRGRKTRYLISDDNDPAGYKSTKGMLAEAELGTQAVPAPASSPDLNLLGFLHLA